MTNFYPISHIVYFKLKATNLSFFLYFYTQHNLFHEILHISKQTKIHFQTKIKNHSKLFFDFLIFPTNSLKNTIFLS